MEYAVQLFRRNDLIVCGRVEPATPTDTTDSAVACCELVLNGRTVYRLSPHPYVRWQSFVADAGQTQILGHTDLEIFHSLGNKSDSLRLPYIDAPSPFLNDILADFCTEAVHAHARKRKQYIVVRAKYYEQFLCYIYNNPGEFHPDLTITLTEVAVEYGHQPYSIRARTLSLQVQTIAKVDTDFAAVAATIERARISRLVVRGPIPHGTAFVNDVLTHATITTSSFNSRFSRLRHLFMDLTFDAADLHLDLTGCPCIAEVAPICTYRSDYLRHLASILVQVPMLRMLPVGRSFHVRGCEPDIVALVATHAPHLLEQLQQPNSFHWTPIVAAAFTQDEITRLAAFVLGVFRIYPDDEIDPAALEYVLREFRAND